MLPTVEIDKNGIFIETHVDEFISVNLAMFVAEERKRLAGKGKKPLLVVFEKVVGYDPETRNYTDQIVANINAMAFYINISTTEGKEAKAIIESFYKMTPYPIPVKTFDDKDEALNWLKQFVQE